MTISGSKDEWRSQPLPAEADLPESNFPAPAAAWATKAGGLLVFALLLVWSQLGGHYFSGVVDHAVEAALVLTAAAFTAMLAARSGRANVTLERAYSEHLEKLSDSLRHIAYHDSLTGLYNHRYFHEQLPHELERASRYGHELSIVMLDVNHFKEVNDRYGHLMGDQLLTFLGRLILENVRVSDTAARYGGDEFAIILPETDGPSARMTAAKLAEMISKRRDWGGGLLQKVALQVSYGVATYPGDATTVEGLLVHADRALYASRSLPLRRTPLPSTRRRKSA
ncbi:MAG: GGDEF domain-containing protein [Dehalococcoidia bacterium]|nr:GGDEF domain-containing protein [Dehalococcoidia bacterium]